MKRTSYYEFSNHYSLTHHPTTQSRALSPVSCALCKTTIWRSAAVFGGSQLVCQIWRKLAVLGGAPDLRHFLNTLSITIQYLAVRGGAWRKPVGPPNFLNTVVNSPLLSYARCHALQRIYGIARFYARCHALHIMYTESRIYASFGEFRGDQPYLLSARCHAIHIMYTECIVS